MPTTPTQYQIGVKVSGGTSSDVYVNFKCGTTIKRVLTSSNEAIVNLGNAIDFPSGFSNGDKIEINATGYRRGGIVHTVDTSKGGATIKLTLTDVSTTNAPAINIG